MPYVLLLVPNSKPKRYYVYNPTNDHYFSKRPLKKKTAEAQIRALHANVAEGEGLRDIVQNVGRTIGRVVKKVIWGQNDLPPRVQSFVDKFGEQTITSATLVREPVQRVIQTLLNAVSLGKFQENVDKLGYDTIYHLSLDFTLSNGTSAKLEKNERLSISEAKFAKKGDTKTLQITFPSITLNEALKKTEQHMGKDNFLLYSAHTRNCQHFIMGVLQANGALTEEAKLFILQDANQLFHKLPGLSKIADKITNLGTTVDTVLQGGKLKKTTVSKAKNSKSNIDYKQDSKPESKASLEQTITSERGKLAALNRKLSSNHKSITPEMKAELQKQVDPIKQTIKALSTRYLQLK